MESEWCVMRQLVHQTPTQSFDIYRRFYFIFFSSFSLSYLFFKNKYNNTSCNDDWIWWCLEADLCLLDIDGGKHNVILTMIYWCLKPLWVFIFKLFFWLALFFLTFYFLNFDGVCLDGYYSLFNTPLTVYVRRLLEGICMYIYKKGKVSWS